MQTCLGAGRTAGHLNQIAKHLHQASWVMIEKLEAGLKAASTEAGAVGLAQRHVSRQLRLAYLAPEVLKRLT
ncbi:hypothetical protein [Celeribacter sp. SCSIO 80788]|uniref:hypothetical protein n=1 Tax=Celeribacter sp. SCSIO 80788 TaxID=3117013 RepID=UPI003DA5B0F3